MPTFNPQQKILLSAEYLLDLNPLKKYELLFDHLNCSPIEKPLSEGRLPVSKSGLLRALVYKNLKPLPTLYDLAVELIDNPGLSLKCGLNPPQHPSPLVERLSSFLRDTPNDSLQQIRRSLVRKLIQLGQITGRFFSIDSCPILANVKENNLKTSVKDRFDKTKIPKGDPDCRLGVMIHFPEPFKKEEFFFWGYRNHAITDTLSELPVGESTIDYGSESFKKIYNLRTSSERIFSRLLTLCMQDPSVIGLNATANYCTIAHITVLLIALTATKTGNKDKIRFVKKFLPNL